MKSIISSILCLFIWLACSAQTNDQYVVVLSLDGFRWDYTDNAHTPTFDSLRKAGSYSEIYPCFPANTFPNHYSMATGLHPDHHGIVNNIFFDKKSGKLFTNKDNSVFMDPQYWRGEPIWNAAERQGLKSAIFMWLGCQIMIGNRQASITVPFDDKVSFRMRTDMVLSQLTREKDSIPRLIMWYIEEPDATAHHHQPGSKQVVQKVEEIDKLLAYFFAEVKKSPVYDKINFIVTSDHGMASISDSRVVNLYPLLDNKRIRRSVNGTPLYLDADNDYVDQAFDIINKQPHLKVFKRNQMPKEYHYGTDTMRITSLVVLPETGYMVRYFETLFPVGEGTHGFDPFDRQMHMIFYASGPSIKKNYTADSFQNLNLHLIIARLLGIKPAEDNDGTPESYEGIFLPATSATSKYL